MINVVSILSLRQYNVMHALNDCAISAPSCPKFDHDTFITCGIKY